MHPGINSWGKLKSFKTDTFLIYPGFGQLNLPGVPCLLSVTRSNYFNNVRILKVKQVS